MILKKFSCVRIQYKLLISSLTLQGVDSGKGSRCKILVKYLVSKLEYDSGA